MRRDRNDLKWKAVKLRVHKRDKNRCGFLSLCTMKEDLLLRALAPSSMLSRIDCSHVFPVGSFRHMTYMEENIVLLNRWSHHNLDDCLHPVTGKAITREERDDFWKRIVGVERYLRLEEISKRNTNVDYEEGEKDGTNA